MKLRARSTMCAATVLTAASIEACQTMASSQVYGGKAVETCPLDLKGAELHVAATDVSADLAHEEADRKFRDAFAIPAEVSRFIPISLLGVCETSEGAFQAEVGVTEAALLQVRDGIVQALAQEPTAADQFTRLKTLVELRQRYRLWRKTKDILKIHDVEVPDLDQAPVQRQLASAAASTPAVLTFSGTSEPVVETSIRAAVLKAGFRLPGATERPSISIAVTLVQEPLPQVGGRFHFTRLSILSSASDASGALRSESKMVFKGGGLSYEQAYQDARAKLEQALTADLVGLIFLGTEAAE